jgi:hypothetical protein
MSEDERQRQMDFILNSLAQLTVKIDSLTENVDSLTENVDGLTDIQRADDVRVGRLEEAFITLAQLSERVVNRPDGHNARITTVENAIVTLTRLVEQRNGGA